MSPASHAPLFTRQWTNAFNQPLTFDTSSVTDMQYMFQVRSAPAQSSSWIAPTCFPEPSTGLRPPALCMPPASHAPLWTRQNTRAFNQPLSFNTSSVRDMQYMFSVRAASAHATRSPVGPMLRVTKATALNALPSPGPPHQPHAMPAFGLGSTRMRSTSR